MVFSNTSAAVEYPLAPFLPCGNPNRSNKILPNSFGEVIKNSQQYTRRQQHEIAFFESPKRFTGLFIKSQQFSADFTDVERRKKEKQSEYDFCNDADDFQRLIDLYAAHFA